jgi:hypothetical protein
MMKQFLFAFGITLLFFSCGPAKEPEEKNKPVDTPLFTAVSTVYNFPEPEVPPGFYYDTVQVYDSACRASYRSRFLQSSLPQFSGFTKALKDAIVRRMKYEQQYVDPYNGDSPVDPAYTYEFGPIAFYMDSQLISCTHVIDTYGEGGNHHNYSWFTFNFDRKKNKPLFFSDFFELRAAKDSVAFVESVYQNRLKDCMDWNAPFDSVDFSFTDTGLYINPELSWACAQNRSFLSNDSLNRYIRKMWRKKK